MKVLYDIREALAVQVAAAVPWVEVCAPEQARFALMTPPMCAWAAFERWHPLIASPDAVSQ